MLFLVAAAAAVMSYNGVSAVLETFFQFSQEGKLGKVT